ncbi:hypothetical protein KSP40_PGU011538 [Platanthera guangdongensis]|uniref:Uncharacterized protein n=1 Tax=Platanthera guangdongensis TaxID=2320717 RepID=A0ABR2MM43_9ASPA
MSLLEHNTHVPGGFGSSCDIRCLHGEEQGAMAYGAFALQTRGTAAMFECLSFSCYQINLSSLIYVDI